MRQSSIAQRDCVIAKLTDRGDLALAFDQREGDALIGRDRRIEGGASLRIFPRLVERGLGAADDLCAISARLKSKRRITWVKP